jgi:hypothetical protein
MTIQAFFEEEEKYLPFFYTGFSIILLVADYFAGPFIQFPITYLIPVVLASWYSSFRWGLTFAVVLPLVRLYFNLFLWAVPWTYIEAGVNCIIRIVVFSLFALLVSRAAKRTSSMTKEISMLSGLLPICSYCKKIRDESNQWQPVERYVSSHSEAFFIHGICPECTEIYFGQMNKKKIEG